MALLSGCRPSYLAGPQLFQRGLVPAPVYSSQLHTQCSLVAGEPERVRFQHSRRRKVVWDDYILQILDRDTSRSILLIADSFAETICIGLVRKVT